MRPEAIFRVLEALWCYLRLIFEHMTTLNEVKSTDSDSFLFKKVVGREKKGETQLGREKLKFKREGGRFCENGLKAGDLPPKTGELESLPYVCTSNLS